MAVNWLDLRPLNGSQHAAFEELCCQLAAAEQHPNGSLFVRKGAPDAGVECYWKMPDESEWGWQAKFFLSPPEDTQWKQIDKSVGTSLEKHPKLSQYIVCLPIDRQDPRVENQRWFMDKWDERVQTWTAWTAARGMAVVFEYWGAHEIFERLSREEHKGRYYFWFHRDLFSQEWFHNRIDEAIANVGPRYSPELDVELQIAKLFDGLGRTPVFYKRVKELLKKIKKTRPQSESKYLPEKSQKISEILDHLWKLLADIDQDNVERIEWNGIGDLTQSGAEIARDSAQTLSSLAEAKEKEPTAETNKKEIDQLRYLASNYWRMYQGLREIYEYAESDEARLSNLSALLLVGEAGRGKTHLLCDVARHRIEADMPTVLLLGGQFNLDEPWSQTTKLLGLSCTKEEFLGALEAAAQAHRARAIILIDALNEGQGKAIWQKHIAGVLLTISRSPWLGIAISVRTSYEDILVPNGLVPSRLIRAEHHGFAEHEYEATKTFFDYFGIQRPRIPLLVPEFQNPLFLKIFCQSLKNSGLTSIPLGMQGITAIFRFFLDSVNKKLSDPEYLNFNPKLPIVWQAVEALATQLAWEGKDWLPIEEAQNVINNVLPRDGYENSLFRHLLAEGVIAENRFYIGDDQWSEGVHFAYERFTDHLVAKHLLDAYLDTNNPASSFEPSTPLAKYVQNERACVMHQGLIEAFAIQIPEQVGKELIELVPSIREFRTVIDAFIDSIIWRHPQAFTTSVAIEYMNTHVIRDWYHHERLLNALLTVAVNPDHPLNADFLHQNLLHFELAERDSWWSIFLHRQYEAHGAVDRLVDWSWSSEDKSHIADESIRLCGVSLAWFLTTSNRSLRDRATKALISLFSQRINVLRTVIQNFIDVNDPYVLERLMAVAYGCAMRSGDNEAIRCLAADVYTWIFQDGHPPVHILLRDYARGVIEVVLHRGIALDIDLPKVRPPYSSTFPENIPTEDELKTKYNTFKEPRKDVEYAQSAIWSSVMGWGDFARYVIGADSRSFSWSSQRLNEPLKPTRQEQYQSFVSTLTAKQKDAVETYRRMRGNLEYYRRLDQAGRKELFNVAVDLSDEQYNELLASVETRLRKQLGKKKSGLLSSDIMRYLVDPHEDEFRFDVSSAQRFILNRVFELGWTIERFGQFDRFVNYRDGRSAHKPERIGKKYQWIAYHEFLARVADNLQFREPYSHHAYRNQYVGPWQIHARDIDPSCLLKSTKRGDAWRPPASAWWFSLAYNSWQIPKDDVLWMKEAVGLPDVKSLIEITNPTDGSQWLALNGFYRWEQPTPLDEERYDVTHREIWYVVNSYLVHLSDIEELSQWGIQQDFMGRWMPETGELYEVFFGEFFWSPAYEYFNDPYERTVGWRGGGSDSRVPKPIMPLTEGYLKEHSGLDCSIDDSYSITLPCQFMVEKMGLQWRGIEGSYFDAADKLVAFDPSVNEAGPGLLLVERKSFLKFLNDNNLAVMWTIIGEKQLIGGDYHYKNYKGRLNLTGAFRILHDQVSGQVILRFDPPASSTVAQKANEFHK